MWKIKMFTSTFYQFCLYRYKMQNTNLTAYFFLVLVMKLIKTLKRPGSITRVGGKQFQNAISSCELTNKRTEKRGCWRIFVSEFLNVGNNGSWNLMARWCDPIRQTSWPARIVKKFFIKILLVFLLSNLPHWIWWETSAPCLLRRTERGRCDEQNSLSSSQSQTTRSLCHSPIGKKRVIETKQEMENKMS